MAIKTPNSMHKMGEQIDFDKKKVVVVLASDAAPPRMQARLGDMSGKSR